jgi:hypothetical protein
MTKAHVELKASHVLDVGCRLAVHIDPLKRYSYHGDTILTQVRYLLDFSVGLVLDFVSQFCSFTI